MSIFSMTLKIFFKVIPTSGEIRMLKLSHIRTNNPCCSILLWTSFYYLQVNKQEHIGMVSTK